MSADAPAGPQHPLVGVGLHRMRAGSVTDQAKIIAIIPSHSAAGGDLALLQGYDWTTGEATSSRLVALADAFADLAADVIEDDLMTEIILKSVLPCLCMEIDGINQRSVDIENNRLGHFESPVRKENAT